MKVHTQEILIYYNPDSSAHRKTVAHAQSLTPHIRTFTFQRGPNTGRLWRSILEMLDLDPKEILNKAHPYYQMYIRGREFDDEGWLNILMRNPDLLRAPIAIRGKKAIICDNSTDIYKLASLPAA